MAAVFGLDDVLRQAFARWPPSTERGAVFGAAGQRDGKDHSLMINLLQKSWPELGMPNVSALELGHAVDPFGRMFNTATGLRAAHAVGNEPRTLAALERLSVEIMAEALLATLLRGGGERLLVIPGEPRRPPVLMLMSPKVNIEESRVISDELDLPIPVLQEAMHRVVDLEENTPEASAFRQVVSGGPVALVELFLISQPEIVLTRRPRMIPLCAPSPHLKVESGGKISTAGVLCRDREGEFGVTACHHGTGDVGAKVSVDLHQSYVKHASEVQDIVFIPLRAGFKQPPLAGRAGVRKDREPAKADHVHFDGATNQNRVTRIFGTDNGLLRASPKVQLKLQTDPDTDEGDSGSALLDDQDQVLGFAFHRTAYDDYPQFTDWIWAANALRALDLTTISPGD